MVGLVPNAPVLVHLESFKNDSGAVPILSRLMEATPVLKGRPLLGPAIEWKLLWTSTVKYSVGYVFLPLHFISVSQLGSYEVM